MITNVEPKDVTVYLHDNDVTFIVCACTIVVATPWQSFTMSMGVSKEYFEILLMRLEAEYG